MSEPVKISWDQYHKFVKDFDNNLFPNQRMGQAFMNEFKIHPDQRLFYLQRRGTILVHIQNNYVHH